MPPPRGTRIVAGARGRSKESARKYTDEHGILARRPPADGSGVDVRARRQRVRAWRADARRCERLSYVSIEKHPFGADDLRTLHARMVDDATVSPLAEQLRDAWPLLTNGLHRLEFEGGRVTLTLAFGDALELLPKLRLRADAFYLDGFSPAKNPDLWSPPVFKALARLATVVGYRVEVFDTRAEALAGDADWPADVRRHLLADYADLPARLRWPELTTVAVMTAAMTQDVEALTALADVNVHWLGVMGSAAKIHEIRARLAARGIAQERIDAIHGPIGLPMKSDTPPEIAVSIVAQLLAERRSTQ